ncbi:hypothetical protein G5B00_08415 [Parapedobacter sp. SGR-10]|uniref:hypothetical protein n=1 Tax=Parapedobacter sp. SGR-10 TaxID=2710879 RepID=UPI0013D87AC4|nr:hypothetical protein [Parapedobacter sp. SGR-10]NGF56538.1 hypothetical protein [Parapedobacter sp. SGR-10]
MIILDILFSLIFIVCAYRVRNLYAFNGGEKKLISLIFVVHTLVCFVATPILFNGGDAKGYWMVPKLFSYDQIWTAVKENPRPTQIMYLINYFFANVFGLSFLTGMLFYSFLGMWGFVLILATIKSFIPDLRVLRGAKVYGIPVYPLVFLLPNMHFWSVGIGKDTLLFFSVSLFMYSLLALGKRFVGMLVAVAIAYFLRPHVLLFMVAGFALPYVFSSRFNIIQKVLMGGAMLALFFPLLNSVLAFAKIEQLSTEHLESFHEGKAAALSVAGSGIDLSALPYPLQVLTFLFRPLFFDAHNVLAIVASIENLIQVFLVLFFLKNRFIRFIRKANFLIKGSFFYYMIGAIAFAPMMSNLGIIIREKNMLMPAFLIFVLAAIQFKRQQRYRYGR